MNWQVGIALVALAGVGGALVGNDEATRRLPNRLLGLLTLGLIPLYGILWREAGLATGMTVLVGVAALARIWRLAACTGAVGGGDVKLLFVLVPLFILYGIDALVEFMLMACVFAVFRAGWEMWRAGRRAEIPLGGPLVGAAILALAPGSFAGS